MTNAEQERDEAVLREAVKNWALKVERAKEARHQGQEARKGKPATFISFIPQQ